MTKKTKITVSIITVVFLISGYLWYDKYKFLYFEFPHEDYELAEFLEVADEEDHERLRKRMREERSKDLYGGNTPQETIDLFVAALRADDVGEASKYFLVGRDRDIYYHHLLKLKKVDNLGWIIENMSRKKKRVIDQDDFVKFGSFGDDGVVDYYFELKLNRETGKWKINDF